MTAKTILFKRTDKAQRVLGLAMGAIELGDPALLTMIKDHAISIIHSINLPPDHDDPMLSTAPCYDPLEEYKFEFDKFEFPNLDDDESKPLPLENKEAFSKLKSISLSPAPKKHTYSQKDLDWKSWPALPLELNGDYSNKCQLIYSYLKQHFGDGFWLDPSVFNKEKPSPDSVTRVLRRHFKHCRLKENSNLQVFYRNGLVYIRLVSKGAKNAELF